MTSQMSSEIVGSDVLAAILATLKDESFTGDSEKIHTTLARAKRHYPILNVFNFSAEDVYPFSRELEEALTILQRSRMIRMQNPDYDTYVVTKSGKLLAENYIKQFKEDEQRQIKELAEIFFVECGNEFALDEEAVK